MGGYGSGRKFGANCTEDHLSFDVRSLQRDKLLFTGNSFTTSWSTNGEKTAAITVKVEANRLRLIYSYQKGDEPRENLNYAVGLQTTNCHYGGLRYWFTCPVAGCGLRVAVLYQGGKIFACRNCYQLVYKSQRETLGNRGYRAIRNIRDHLGWSGGICHPIGNKPKGMHWKTYIKLLSKYTNYAESSMLEMQAHMHVTNDRVAKLQEKYDL